MEKLKSWKVVSTVKNDLKFIENYIKNNETLKHFFSALPSSTYYMLIYDIWCNGQPFLNHQKQFIEKNFSPEMCKTLEQQSKNNNYFNPKGCIDDLIYKLYFECQQPAFTNITLIIYKISLDGSTLNIYFKKHSIFAKLNKLRTKIINTCEKNDNMKNYYITVAHLHTATNTETQKGIDNWIKILNMLLCGQTVTINKPNIYQFTDIKSFKLFSPKSSLHKQNPFGQNLQQNPFGQNLQQNPFGQNQQQNPFGLQQNPFGLQQNTVVKSQSQFSFFK